MNLYEVLIDPFNLPFMMRALGVGVGIAIGCSLLSCFLIHLGWSLIGDAVSHAVLPGVVFAFLLQVPYTIGALVFAFIAVAIIGSLRKSQVLGQDAAIGITFTTLFAIGLILITATPSSVDLGHILFGNLLGIATTEIWQVLVLVVIVVGVLLWKWRDILLVALDPGYAHAIGIGVGRINALMLLLLACTTVAGMQAAGVILVVALLITPGAAAQHLTWSFPRMMTYAVLISVSATYVGLLLSFHLNTSSGGMVVIAHSAIFFVCFIFGRRGLMQQRMKPKVA